MPYIEHSERGKYEKCIQELLKILKGRPLQEVDGELDYVITSLLKGLYEPKYFNYNRAIGVLETTKQEFYRRALAPYEDEKIEEAGDVY
ncbi:MAG: hypothetical protein A3K61_07405 [Thaumarchaeota archaeon RBG_16_49_8]|nr:MAG: hypothetical protein A3K61_07405 [Thaumarchaeota archaeon RBG_16_49_8]